MPLFSGGLIEYNAISDRQVRPLPPLPQMGPAGSVIIDPTFQTRIARATDSGTDPSFSGSYWTTGGSFIQAWSQDSTRFFTLTADGGYAAFDFDAGSMRASFIGRLPIYGPCWGGPDRNVIYGTADRKIVAYNLASHTTSTVLTLDDVMPGWTQATYALSCTPDGNVFAISFGGIQDTHPYLVHYDRRTGRRQLLNLRNGTVDGRPLPFRVTPNAGLHGQDIDKTGRYVSFIGPGIPASNAAFWDTQTGDVVAQTRRWSGHAALGYGTQVNQSGYEQNGVSDSRGFVLRYLDRPNDSIVELISPAPEGPYDWGADGHWSWNNARPDALTPLVGTFYRNGGRWGVWDGEIVGVRTDGAASTVWRFAHHRSLTNGANFGYDQPHGNVSPDGRYYIFTSNWGRSLGNNRQDVFVVELGLAASGASGPAAPPALPPALPPGVAPGIVPLPTGVGGETEPPPADTPPAYNYGPPAQYIPPDGSSTGWQPYTPYMPPPQQGPPPTPYIPASPPAAMLPPPQESSPLPDNTPSFEWPVVAYTPPAQSPPFTWMPPTPYVSPGGSGPVQYQTPYQPRPTPYVPPGN